MEIAKSQHCLLGFAYEDWKGRERYFQFVVLPFGLATAGQIFSKVWREIVKTWRKQSIKAVVFLDDGLQCHKDYQTTRHSALIIKGSLLASGWVPDRTKSCWIPKQVISWLGFIIDLLQGQIFCSEDRILKTALLLSSALLHKRIHVKFLAKISGTIISMERSHGDLVYLKTRFMNLAIAEADTWNTVIIKCYALRDELRFWKSHIRQENGHSLFASADSTSIAFSDASGTGCASVHTPIDGKKLIVNRVFNSAEAKTSSTERELLGVLHGITELKEVLRGKTMNWYTDAKNVVRIVRRGSNKPYLLNIALAIFHIT